jgi:hypothetical protein
MVYYWLDRALIELSPGARRDMLCDLLQTSGQRRLKVWGGLPGAVGNGRPFLMSRIRRKLMPHGEHKDETVAGYGGVFGLRGMRQ